MANGIPIIKTVNELFLYSKGKFDEIDGKLQVIEERAKSKSRFVMWGITALIALGQLAIAYGLYKLQQGIK